jgi:hypothetical protein
MRILRVLFVLVLSVFGHICLLVTILFPNVTQAMDIVEFDKMADADRQAYLDFLVDAAQNVLISQARKDDAAKVYRLFHEIQPGDAFPLGEKIFKQNLEGLRVRDDLRHSHDHNARRIQVEAALLATLKENNISMTIDGVKQLLQMSTTFRPSYPLR